METTINTSDKILMTLLKESFTTHTITSLAVALCLTRQGIWKVVKKLVDNDLIALETIGKTKTSTSTIKLNWSVPLTEKTLSLLLTKEALKQERWRVNFAELEEYVSFLVLFGSILRNSKEAKDIDSLVIINNNKNFKHIKETILRIQKTQLKKIHNISVSETEFTHELKKPNNAYRDALKRGIILFGQENFVQYIKKLQTL